MEIESKLIKRQIDESLTLLKNVLGENLLGVYLYGSILMGGLQKYSDIDLFAVVVRETTKQEKEKIAKALLNISGIYTVSKDIKPIELTIVVKAQVNPWIYPPSFDFLYGDWLRKDFEAGNIEPWQTKESPNLALVITQLLLSNQVLFGPNPEILLDSVPYLDFIHASTREIESVLNDLDWDTRNVLLTLARIWNTVETDAIRSKPEAADWSISKLPEIFKPILFRAKSILLGEQLENWDDLTSEIKPCAEYIVEQIKKQMSKLQTSDNTNRSIVLKE